MKKLSKEEIFLKKVLEQADKDLDEMSTSAAVPGYLTPNAFSDDEGNEKGGNQDAAQTSGMRLAEDDDLPQDEYDGSGNQKRANGTPKLFQPKIWDDSLSKKESSLKEISYNNYKNDPNATAKQKVNQAIHEINSMLGRMEQIVNHNIKLRQEAGVDTNQYWKSTRVKLGSIAERLIRVGTKMKNLGA